jgi:hypothetical protein
MPLQSGGVKKHGVNLARGLMMVGIEFGSTCNGFYPITHGSAQIELTRKYASFDRHLLLYAEWNGRI